MNMMLTNRLGLAQVGSSSNDNAHELYLFIRCLYTMMHLEDVNVLSDCLGVSNPMKSIAFPLQLN